MRILEVEDLNKRFGGLTVASDIGCHVEEGEIVGLIGPNGAGKTTLFNLISGAVAPDSGAIRFKGRDISGQSPHKICHAGIARTFQSVKVFPAMSVFNSTLLGLQFGKPAAPRGAEARKMTWEILEFVGLAGLADSRGMDLTLASQKRLEVARALATRPALLMLDEVMAGLTPTEVAHSMELVERIRGRGVAVIMIEHVMKAIMTVCDRVIVLHHGEKIAEGCPGDITQNRTVIEVYLGE